jgi:hypothetical protein
MQDNTVVNRYLPSKEVLRLRLTRDDWTEFDISQVVDACAVSCCEMFLKLLVGLGGTTKGYKTKGELYRSG